LLLKVNKFMNIKELIDTLNTIDVKDLKNIDLQEVKYFMRTRLDGIGLIFLILLSLILILNGYSGHQKKSKKIKQETVELQEKIEEYKKYQKIVQERKQFIKNFPVALSRDHLTEKVYEIAKKHNIQIVSFSPSQEEADDLVQLTAINMGVISDAYASLVKFIYEIESSSYGIYIKKFGFEDGKSARPRRRSVRGDQQKEEKKDKEMVKVEMKVVSMKLKNE